jgi:hypothetical protein
MIVVGSKLVFQFDKVTRTHAFFNRGHGIHFSILNLFPATS